MILSEDEVFEIVNEKGKTRTGMVRKAEQRILEKLTERAGPLPRSRAVLETLNTLFGKKEAASEESDSIFGKIDKAARR